MATVGDGGKEEVAGVVCCLILLLYATLGLLQAVFLFGTGPGASMDRLVLNVQIWGGVMLACLYLIVYLSLKLRRVQRRPSTCGKEC